MGLKEGSAQFRFRVYYWPNGFLLATPSWNLDRRDKPYRRISATLILGLSKAFELEIADGETLVGNAVLLGPKVLRRRISASKADVVICDLSVASPSYQALNPLFQDKAVQRIELDRLAPVLPQFRQALTGELDHAAVIPLINQTVELITACDLPQPQAACLPRAVRQAVQIIEQQPMDEISAAHLAERVHLSSSRLRVLFSQHMHCTIPEYLRWSAAWKAIWLWSQGRPMIEIAMAAGFHDNAHLNRAFNEVFGLNPTEVFHPGQIDLHRCEQE